MAKDKSLVVTPMNDITGKAGNKTATKSGVFNGIDCAGAPKRTMGPNSQPEKVMESLPVKVAPKDDPLTFVTTPAKPGKD